ncbi:MAG TPA: sulfatase-like hydrolase/transferase [Phycisphaerae bacterium]|nr:sulfatase-like hydrolase/transferase [Phycisphaerae bacterium]
MSTDRKPNIILVYTDQQRYDTLGVNGNPLIGTPNLDAFARQGVNFARGYVTTPICLPSRAALFTGRYNHANGSYNNSRWMFDRETDLAALLKGHGYRTALIGKDHCFGGDRLGRAFDHVRRAAHIAFNPAQNEGEQRINDLRRDKMQVPFADDPIPPEQNITGSLFRWAREYVDGAGCEPFFLWLSISDPHPPYMVCEPYAGMYEDVEIPAPAWEEGETANKPFRQRQVVEWDRYGREYPGDAIDKLRRIYWGMVSYIDAEMGRLLDHLHRRGRDEDTVVLFTSDHGDYMGDHRMIRKGPHLYEALAHVPLIARWCGQFPARATDAMAANIDIFPTLCELAGVPVPQHVQGRSFAGLLRGQRDTHRDMVFLEHGDPGRPLQPGDLSPERVEELKRDTGHHLCHEISRGRVKGVRSDRWKYCITPGDVDELYDLQTDPDELHNLAGDPACQVVLAEHRRHILHWLIETEDTLTDERR